MNYPRFFSNSSFTCCSKDVNQVYKMNLLRGAFVIKCEVINSKYHLKPLKAISFEIK